ncbi:dihydroneopterin aldolase [Falsirhodobacter sp. 20TX0035]|uniref:dihydroneopterin aldolase n=1 Tax=Falsirhodobacter sp. 20TX0035 TaxID=3022019 RepID=UPI0023313A52|nr:dihydroneopterin aldolase [Falsirhodobacter sp. 20TX0035]MDB6454852.1 dihydroneopterin aldolase [Falsirhodobacter sp. 20TX0035]
MDRIFLRDHVVETDIGAFEVERGRPQRLRFAVEVEVAHVQAHDNVDLILSYDRIREAITDELARGRVALLETLADGIAARLLAHPQARVVHLEIEKMDRGPFRLGIRATRRRGEVELATRDAEAPTVVYLGQGGQPVAGAVNCVAGTPATGPDAPAQRRLNLLAVEQAAWLRSGPGTTVAGTWTEMDWALRQGLAVIWAPSKMVLEAADPPSSTAPDALAVWLAEQLGCRTITALETISAESRVAVIPG